MNFGAPEIVWAVFCAIALLIHLWKHGEPHAPYNFNDACFNFLLHSVILYWGGFFS